MNFLSICQKVSGLAGMGATNPTTVVAQDGDMGRIVNWVNECWIAIQSMRPDWYWMRNDFTFDTSAAKSEYTPTDVGINTTLDRYKTETFRIYRVSDGNNKAERFLNPRSWEDWLNLWGYGSHEDNYPYDFTIKKPGDSILLAPGPDDVFRIRGEYQHLPTEMTLDTDIPALPTKFHYLLVYEALKLYSIWDNAPEKLGLSLEQIESYRNDLIADQGQPMRLRSNPTSGGSRRGDSRAWMYGRYDG